MKHDGGPAFPGATPKELGMTLRDYFAAASLSGLISSQIDTTSSIEDHGDFRELYAAAAYGIADAMLAERLK
jgi:hypothetical protein